MASQPLPAPERVDPEGRAASDVPAAANILDPKSAVEREGDRPQMVRLFVRRTNPARVGYLVRLMALDVWGGTLLGGRAAADMALGALALGISFTFGVATASLWMFYILQSADVAVGWRSIAAVCSGFIWSGGIFVITRGLFTTDLSRPGAAKWGGVAARVALILLSSFVSAQPIEQLMFRGMIEERLKQQTLREEAVAHVAHLNERLQRADPEHQRSPDHAADAETIRRFVDDMRVANYGEEVKGPDGGAVRWKRADFFERSLILGELRAGLPPRWPSVAPDLREEAARLFRLHDVGTPEAGATQAVFWMWFVVILLAGGIALLPVGFVFAGSRELRMYYSLAAQARAGNPEALLQQHAGARS